MTNNDCTLTMTVTGTTDVKAFTSCSCGGLKREWDSPEEALAEWRAHTVRRSYARQFTNA